MGGADVRSMHAVEWWSKSLFVKTLVSRAERDSSAHGCVTPFVAQCQLDFNMCCAAQKYATVRLLTVNADRNTQD